MFYFSKHFSNFSNVKSHFKPKEFSVKMAQYQEEIFVVSTDQKFLAKKRFFSEIISEKSFQANKFNSMQLYLTTLKVFWQWCPIWWRKKFQEKFFFKKPKDKGFTLLFSTLIKFLIRGGHLVWLANCIHGNFCNFSK